MRGKMNRRTFVKKSAKAGLSFALTGSIIPHISRGSFLAQAKENPDIAVAAGSDYFQTTMKAVEILGGMGRFVSKGSRVALLPNVQSRHPGAFTKPEVFRAVIRLCREAGAQETNCPSWQSLKNWEDTGLAKVAEEEGAVLKLVSRDEENFRPVPIPGGKDLKEARLLNEFSNDDILINLPITKDHAGNKFTGTLKNLMGLNSPVNNRTFHREDWKTNPDSIQFLDQCIVDLNQAVKPALCIVDATEFITTNGPFGPGDLLKPQKVVAGVDRVAVDAYCASLWELKGEDIFHIRLGAEQGLGRMDLSRVKVIEIKT